MTTRSNGLVYGRNNTSGGCQPSYIETSLRQAVLNGGIAVSEEELAGLSHLTAAAWQASGGSQAKFRANLNQRLHGMPNAKKYLAVLSLILALQGLVVPGHASATSLGVSAGAEDILVGSAPTSIGSISVTGIALSGSRSMGVYSGGLATATSIGDDGLLFVYAGGQATSSIVGPGGFLYGFSGGSTFGTVVSGKVSAEFVFAGGMATGTTVLAGAQHVYSGGVAISTTVFDGKQTIFEGGSAIGTTVHAGRTRYAAGGSSLHLGGYNAIRAGGTLKASAVTLDTSATLEMEVASGQSKTEAANFIGSGNLVKTGEGILFLSGSNAHASTIVSEGTLGIGSDYNLGLRENILSSGGNLLLTGSSYAKGWTLAGGEASIETSEAVNGMTTMKSFLTGEGTLVKTGQGTLLLEADNDYAGGTMVKAGTLRGNITDGTNLTVAQGAVYDAAGADGSAVARTISRLDGMGTVRNTNGLSISQGNFGGTIDATNIGGLTKVGDGTLRLAGENEYVGDTVIMGGTLAGNIPTQTILTVAEGAAYNGAATDGNAAVARSLPIAAPRTVRELNGGGAIQYTDGLTISGGGVFTGSIDATNTDIVKAGSATLRLAGNNTYTGATYVSGGTLEGNITPGTNLTVLEGATYDGAEEARTIGSLSGAGEVRNARELTVREGNFAGQILDTSSLTKVNTDTTLTLTHADAFYGDLLTFREGTLALSGTSASISPTALVMWGGAALDLSQAQEYGTAPARALRGTTGQRILPDPTFDLTNGPSGSHASIIGSVRLGGTKDTRGRIEFIVPQAAENGTVLLVVKGSAMASHADIFLTFPQGAPDLAVSERLVLIDVEEGNTGTYALDTLSLKLDSKATYALQLEVEADDLVARRLGTAEAPDTTDSAPEAKALLATTGDEDAAPSPTSTAEEPGTTDSAPEAKALLATTGDEDAAPSPTNETIEETQETPVTLANTAPVPESQYTDPLRRRAKAFAESRLAQLALINKGQDHVADAGMARMLATTSGEGMHIAAFGSVDAGWSTYDTGSHIDLSSQALLVGVGVGGDSPLGRLSIGAFFEAGWGNYRTHNGFEGVETIEGSGNASFYGCGGLARLDAASGFHLDVSLRGGWTRLGYSTDDVRSSDGETSFDTDANYFGGHGRVGWRLALPWLDATLLDISAMATWSHLAADDVDVGQDGRLHLEEADSLRTRLGGRATREFGEQLGIYAGAYWEHEFQGAQHATLNGVDATAPTLKGDTGIGEIGVRFRPSENLPLAIDIQAQGHTGRRTGIGGNLQLMLEF